MYVLCRRIAIPEEGFFLHVVDTVGIVSFQYGVVFHNKYSTINSYSPKIAVELPI